MKSEIKGAKPISRTLEDHPRTYSSSLPLLGIAVFAALTSIGGFLRIPLPPVPFTLQTLFVYLSGDVLGSRRGSQSQLTFLILGLMGLPVFALGGGLGYVLQPTFGYLAGFPIAAWSIGRILEIRKRPHRWIDLTAANAVGMLIVFFTGVVYLFINLNFIVHQSMPLKTALLSGMIIFLPGELLKMMLAALLSQRIDPWIGRSR